MVSNEKLHQYAKISGVALIPISILLLFIGSVIYHRQKGYIFTLAGDILFWFICLVVAYVLNFVSMVPDYNI
tara:strand:+ start:263 stop:478 length:216 start_codon:yes stop_codon:yes gene_type:complete